MARMASRRVLLLVSAFFISTVLYSWLNSSMFVQPEHHYYDIFDYAPTGGDLNVQNFSATDNGHKHFIFKHQNKILKATATFTKEYDDILANFGLLPEKSFSIPSIEQFHGFPLNDEYVLVTAFSNDHYPEAMNLLRSISHAYSNQRVLTIYNIGLSQSFIEDLNMSYSKVIREIVNFSFKSYPRYVEQLYQYRWKPLVIAQELKKHHGKNLVWMDTSIVIKKQLPTIKELYESWDFTSHYGSWLLFDQTGHSIFAATTPVMYFFLPLPKPAYKFMMYGANLQIIFSGMKSPANKFIAEWWVRCSLDKNCMAPIGSQLICDFQYAIFEQDRMGSYGNCHRYDQSALNILLAWVNDFNTSRYGEGHAIFKDTFAVERVRPSWSH